MPDSLLQMKSARPWTSILSAGQQSAALFVAQDVVGRVTDHRILMETLAAAHHQTQYPDSIVWQPHGLASGNAGIAVVCSYVDQYLPNKGWDAVGHEFLVASTRAAQRSPQLSSGLFAGLSGLAFAVHSLSRDGERYRRLLSALDQDLVPRTASIAAQLRRDATGMPVSAFDVVSGASGIAAYLLARDPYRLLPDLLTALVQLAAPTDGIPRWATPPEFLLNDPIRDSFPSGCLNCGLAHGIPGPLAVLSLALRAGHEVPGQAEAISSLAGWLVAHQVHDAWGAAWPAALPLAPPTGPPLPVGGSRRARSAWCYGGPGVARALWLAGEALEDSGWRRLAVEAIASVLRSPVSQRHVDSSTFCHGVSGLLHIVLRFAHDTGDDVLVDGARTLVDQLLRAYEHDRPFGYADLEPGGNSVDRADLLSGASGVAMVLHAAATGAEPVWDRMFLLS
ncbi:hypothetical protein QF035_008855 [Streptomyces umbrinus]|uniref:Uncharacterized protein n=1 Tax=Streptomyces umbrinus TaxID=67370 RepID=A0ABU0T637_9ACTN|nr:lanthionine synthetase C family protein [Streptomyces umbrinus]MDQ1031273.1 hypothetical protein [Streptomyces umbrinus]